jgi:AraC-like DNA-binding protein
MSQISNRLLMLQTRIAPPTSALRPYVWAYGMTTGRVETVPLVIPLPARPKQLLTFFFEDRYCVLRPGGTQSDPAPRVTVVGPQSFAHSGLSVLGRVDNFTVIFQPSGFNWLFGIPMTELTDRAYDARAVIGPGISRIEHDLGDAHSFAERIQVIERPLLDLLRNEAPADPVGIAANSLFANHGIHRVAAMAAHSGLSPRQFERRFLAQVGLPPKLYARIVRFNAALDHKLRYPGRSWSRIAVDHDYYDQTHFVHDCRAFTGEVPSQFLAQLDDLPALHALFATTNLPRPG